MKRFDIAEAQKQVNKVRSQAIDFIRHSILEQHSGHHVLCNESETFIESPFEDDDAWKVVEIKVDGKDDGVYYTHSNPYDEYDWHYIGGMCIEDLLYVAGLYS